MQKNKINFEQKEEEITSKIKLDPIDNVNLGINKNILYKKNKNELIDKENEKNLRDDNNINKKVIKDNDKLTFQPELKKKNIISPKYSDYDVYDPQCEIFNPNYQIGQKEIIKPNSGDTNIDINIGKNKKSENPFFSTDEGTTQGGELVGPSSDIFSHEHPHMKKKPSTNIRYDPIGPFGTHGVDDDKEFDGSFNDEDI